MIDYGAKVRGLIELAVNDGASTEERRTAAFTAVQIMHKYDVTSERTEARAFNEDFERRHFNACLSSEYYRQMGRVYDVLRELMGHQGEEVRGRAELNRLVFSLASICGDIVLGIDNLAEHTEELKACLPAVIEAFSQWEAGQPPTDQTRLRSHLVAGFDAQP